MARKKTAEEPQARPEDKPKKKPGRIKQMWQVYRMTAEYDRWITFWMLLIVIGVEGIAVAVGLLWDSVPGGWIYTSIIGLPVGVLGAMYLLARRAETAAYARIEGQPGATGAALGSMRRGWSVEEQPAAIDPRTQDMVFRAVGRAGVALVSEGPSHRVKRLLVQETKRINRLLPGVPVTVFEVGDGEGQIPLRKIASKLQRQRPVITKQEAAEVMRRLRAMGGVKMPVPKGIDPMKARPDRKGMRGR